MQISGRRVKLIDETEPWMISYADMVTLLLAFFVTLISATQISKVKLELLSKYFATTPSSTMPITELAERIDSLVKGSPAKDSIKVFLTDKGVEINVVEKLLFDKGKVELKPECLPILNTIEALLAHPSVKERKVIVEGHTDSLPIKTAVFASNWELASARACQVVRFFISKGLDKNRFQAMGFADTKPLAPDDPVNGQPLNRRVLLIVY